MAVLKYRDPTTGLWILIPSGAKGDRGDSGPPGGVFVGAIIPFGGVSAKIPDGYYGCIGGVKNRITDSVLYNAIGTTWGVGDGVNTFGLPDLQGRTLFGSSGAFPLGTVGGSADAILPAHTHTVRSNSQTTDWQSADHAHSGSTGGQSANHNHYYDLADILTTGGGGSYRAGYTVNGKLTNVANQDHAHSFGTGGVNTNHYHSVYNDNSGVSATNGRLPPWAAVTYVIKY